MGKSLFLKHFQNNLEVELREVIKVWGLDNIEVASEDSVLPSAFQGFMDLSIYDKEDSNKNKVIAIEIEHLSEYRQARQNIDKMRSWCHRSINRSCGLLHVFNEDCNIHPDKIDEMIYYGKQYQNKGSKFYYDFIFYKVDDKRMTANVAQKLANSMDFLTRLWLLMKEVGLV